MSLKTIAELAPVITAIIGFAVLAGCGDDYNPADSGQSVLMPLSVGNYWTYYNRYGLKRNDEWITREDTITIEIVSDTLIDDEKWYVTTTRELKNKADGLWIRNHEGLDSIGYLVYKYPAAVGDTYVNDLSPIRCSTVVTQIPALIYVPAGQFSCIEYEEHWLPGNIVTKAYYAPNTGLIHKIGWTLLADNDTIGFYRQELAEYNIE